MLFILKQVYYLLMATVYLPFGYPLLSGSPFDTVIYQGTVCRLYTEVEDPRTNSQLFQRKMFADMGKLRKTLGAWVKAAMRSVLGSSWSGNLTQLIKADSNGHWSAAWDAWTHMGRGGNQAWNAVAPYTATYNEPGRVFWCMAKALTSYLHDFTGFYWGGADWNEGQYDAALAWWEKDLSSAVMDEAIEEDSTKATRVGTWTRLYQANARGQHYSECDNDPTGRWAAYCYGQHIGFYFVAGTHWTDSATVFVDGAQQAAVNQHGQYGSLGSTAYDFDKKGLHYFELRGESGKVVNIDQLSIG